MLRVKEAFSGFVDTGPSPPTRRLKISVLCAIEERKERKKERTLLARRDVRVRVSLGLSVGKDGGPVVRWFVG